ncbi:ABATE domain-containing protein [Streptomyces sp. NPDC000594]|uniref:CGNR zinc finger domain-containing protein n=1 Tax=Streptomyces sp. NPDC000594 TaxID=3154261 RepID=UPI0033240A80
MGGSTQRRSPGSDPDHLPLTGEPLPLELVNTTFVHGGLRGRLVDALAAPAALTGWFGSRRALFSPALRPLLDAAGAPDAAQVERCRELRRALRDLCAARVAGGAPPAGATAVVNTAARSAAPWLELGTGPGFTAVPHWPQGDPVLTALGEIALAGVELLTGERAGLLRACPAPACVLYFVQGHPRRTWCTPGCGNRVRVARHSRRTRGGDTSSAG